MEGGILAWKGLVAKGVPEMGMTYFSPAQTLEQLMALSWILEEGARKFYLEISRMLKDQTSGKLFEELSHNEETHKESISRLYREVTGKKFDPGFPGSILAEKPGEEYMEDGVRLSEALKWARDEGPMGILDLSISLEANSHDLYIKMERKVEDNQSKKVFHSLSTDEKEHLARLTVLLEKGLNEQGK